MNAKELATKLNGCQYRDEISRTDEIAARMNGLVIVFGASDDLMEFRGVINDECGGDVVLVDHKGLLPDFDQVCREGNKGALRDYFQREARARKITAKWDTEGYSWTYMTDIPHETFDVMEDDGKYCRGIVFSLADLTIERATS